MKQRKWQPALAIRNAQGAGHTYYTDGDDIACADQSMRDTRDPATSDDGLLLIDRSRPVAFYCDNRVAIPLYDPNREARKSSTPGCWQEGLAVCEKFKLTPSFHPTLAKLIVFGMLHLADEVVVVAA